MNATTSEIRDALDEYRAGSGARRIEMSTHAIQRLFIAERIWRGINKVDMTEERIYKGEID